MKHIFRILFMMSVMTFLFKMTAFADGYQNVKELKETSVNSWTQVYHTVRGETVTVDVSIGIPDVESFPCLEAKWIGPSEKITKTKSNLTQFIEQDEIEFENSADFFCLRYPNRTTIRRMEKAAKKNGIYKENRGEPRHLFLTYGQFELNTPYAVNNAETIMSATSALEGILNKYYPDQGIELIPHGIEAYIDPGKYVFNKNTGNYEKVEDRPEFEGVLFVRYDQLLKGIPVIGYSYDGFFPPYEKSELLGSLGGDVITHGMRYVGSDDSWWHFGLKLLMISKVQREDVPLASVSKVIETAGDYITEGKLRSVDSLRLGYVAWLNKDGGFTLMPTWVIEGEVFADAQKGYEAPHNIFNNRPQEYMNLYINAQTGEIIDPNQKGADRAYMAPRLINW